MEKVNGYTIIEIESFMDLGSVCPTQMEFEDTEGHEYYFRLRHGYASLKDTTTNKDVIESCLMGEGLDGLCSTFDLFMWAESKKVIIVGLPDVDYDRMFGL